MKVAVVGSRKLTVDDLGSYLPPETDEIVSGGASGVDSCARKYALDNDIALTEFLPDYKRFGKAAPLKRNLEIVEYADMVIVFWNGESRGIAHIIEDSKKKGRRIEIFIPDIRQTETQKFVRIFAPS